MFKSFCKFRLSPRLISSDHVLDLYFFKLIFVNDYFGAEKYNNLSVKDKYAALVFDHVVLGGQACGGNEQCCLISRFW